jgi:hypothetical protein
MMTRCGGSQRVIDLADGDPFKGNFIFGSPLALALAQRAVARYGTGQGGWRDDLRQAVAMGRSADPMIYAGIICWAYFPGIPNGALAAEDRALRDIEDALRIAERSGDDHALAFARMTLGIALVHRQTEVERDRGEKLLADVREVFVRRGHHLSELHIVDVCAARARARRGDLDGAIPVIRATADHLFREGRLGAGGIATSPLVESLLDRGADGDLEEAGVRLTAWFERSRPATRQLTSRCCDCGLYWRALKATTALIAIIGNATASWP